ncbi:MAG: lipopolysaccharide transport periplasmic protein LptA [Mariprofundaceae bacterium]|nr:lipopolysaccharide transport periplasmic protein LptA [Mariprofundaceae bacterium]
MKKYFFSITCLLMVLCFASIATAEPVDIASESVNVDHAHSRAEFTGAVVLIQGDFTLKCDRLEAWYVKGDLDHAEAFGHVTFHRKDINGASKRASFQKQTGILILFEQATVRSPEGTVSGEKITHNIQTETTHVKKTADGRVHVTIDADKTEALKKK